MTHMLCRIQGDFAEAMFIAEVLKRGGEVTKPFGGHTPYDLVVRFKKGWKTVQVKSTRGAADSRRGPSSMQKVIQLRGIDRANIDYFVGLLIPDMSWWIVPMNELPPATSLALSSRPKALAHRFFNAWTLLT